MRTATLDLAPKQRENVIVREHRTVFIEQIGGVLKSGKPHDGRAPDYDDWSMNGDLLFWHEPLGMALEISSMGIRVDENSLAAQLKIAGCEARAELPFHKMLLNGELPLTIGGGIGQSRLLYASARQSTYRRGASFPLGRGDPPRLCRKGRYPAVILLEAE